MLIFFIKRIQYWNTGSCILLYSTGFLFFLNAIYLQSHLNLSSVHVGNMFVLQGIGYFMASLFSVRFVIKYDYKIMLGGSCIMILALVLHICYFTTEHINNILIYFILFLYGIGCGTMLPSMMTMALRKISSNLTASASGVYLTVQQISIALGVSIIGGIFFHLLGQNGDLLKATVAYHYSTYANILALVIVGGIFLFLSSRRNNAKE